MRTEEGLDDLGDRGLHRGEAGGKGRRELDVGRHGRERDGQGRDVAFKEAQLLAC